MIGHPPNFEVQFIRNWIVESDSQLIQSWLSGLVAKLANNLKVEKNKKNKKKQTNKQTNKQKKPNHNLH